MEALYKMKNTKASQTDRGVRAKIKETASKTSRADLLDSKRRLLLSEVQLSSKNKVSEKDKPTKSRYERLLEWRKHREEEKKLLKKGKKPPFRPPGAVQKSLMSSCTYEPKSTKRFQPPFHARSPTTTTTAVSKKPDVTTKPPDARDGLKKHTTRTSTAKTAKTEIPIESDEMDQGEGKSLDSDVLHLPLTLGFDDTFVSVSFSRPFHFTATQSNAVYSSPEVQPEQPQFVVGNHEKAPTSGDDGDVDTPSSSCDADFVDTEEENQPPATKRCCSSLRSLVVAPMSADSKSGTNNSTEGDEKGFFDGLYTKAIEDFTKLCHKWDDKCNKLEEEYSNDQSGGKDINIEDVLGQIRTTVYLAKLLMRKKLKQHIHPMEKAQDPMVEKRANVEDLQSFWDMVHFQIEDVRKLFNVLAQLEKNGWKEKAPTPARKKVKKRNAALKRMKTVHTPKLGSTSRERRLRRSQRLASRLVFSPIASATSNTCVIEVPTGCLVSFTPMK